MSPAGQGGPPSHHAALCDLTKTAAFLCGGSLGTLDNFLSIFVRITHQGKKGKNYTWNLGYCYSFRKEDWLPRWLSGKESACDAGDWVWSLGQENRLEKEMATYSSILAWRIPWTQELGGLQSMGSQRVGHNWATTFPSLCKIISWKRQWHQYSYLENPMDRAAW